MNRDIPSLTGLRAIAALWVFAFHASNHFLVLKTVGGAGYLGVDIFFVLSGFVLALNYAEEGVHQSLARYTGFLWKRLARIYPIHLAALGLLILEVIGFAACGAVYLSPHYFTIGGLVKTLTLTHGWSVPIAQTWNTVSWSISCEWAAYLAFPVIAVMVQRFRSPLALLSVLLLLFTALFLTLNVRNYAGSMAYGLPRIAVEFSAGVLLQRLWIVRGAKQGALGDWLAALSLLALIAGSSALVWAFSWDTPFAWIPAFAALAVYGLASAQGPLERWLSTPAAQFAGHISFAFYMVHAMVLGLVDKLLHLSGLSGYTAAVIVAALIAAVTTAGIATLLYRFVETPARRAMLRWRPRGAGVISVQGV